MPHSMTAFASQALNTEFGDIVCEVRSVNSRFLDLNISLASSVKHLEQAITNRIKNNITRGKVEFKFIVNANQDLEEVKINTNKFQDFKYILELIDNDLEGVFYAKTVDLVRLLQLPNLLTYEQKTSEKFDAYCMKLIDQAIQEFMLTRQIEGKKLAEFILEKTKIANQILQQIEALAENSVSSLQKKLTDKLDKLNVIVADDRLAQEIAILVQKFDIYEELDRLKTHFIALENIIGAGGTCGRKLDFLLQELQREANTLAAKAQSIEISNLAIELKVINEQIREQIQNLE